MVYESKLTHNSLAHYLNFRKILGADPEKQTFQALAENWVNMLLLQQKPI